MRLEGPVVACALAAVLSSCRNPIDIFDRPIDETRGCPGALSSIVAGRPGVCAASSMTLAVSQREVCTISSSEVACWRGGAPIVYVHPAGREFRTIAVGGPATPSGTDGVICAIDVDGELYCWGDATNGRLGLGAGVDIAAQPTRVGTDLWRSVASGVNATCGVTEGGELYCWGIGLLGISSDPVGGPEPQRIRERDDWELVVGTNSHFCAISRAGEIRCFGQFRTGATVPPIFEYDDIIDIPPVVTAAAGHRSVCAIDLDQRVWCWGERRLLGVPVTSGAEDVAGPFLVDGVHAQRIAIGGTRTCTASVGTTPGRYCWGGGDSAVILPEFTETTQILTGIAGANLVMCAREQGRIGCTGTGSTLITGPAEDGWATTATVP